MWLERNDVSVCLKHPGFDFDVLLTADLAAIYQFWGWRETFAGALHCGQVTLDGSPAPSPAGWAGDRALHCCRTALHTHRLPGRHRGAAQRTPGRDQWTTASTIARNSTLPQCVHWLTCWRTPPAPLE
jgi:hypothetical protein